MPKVMVVTRAVLALICLSLIPGAACVADREIGESATPTDVTDPDPPEDDERERLRFTDVAKGAGLEVLPDDGPTYGSLFADFDLDGWPDLVVGRHKRNPRVFKNDEGHFDLVKIHRLQRPAPGRDIYDLHGCAWGEATADARPDLFCVSGAQDGSGRGPNRLFAQQDGGAGFTLKTPKVLRDPEGRGRTANWFDMDGDGDLDLFVGNEIRDGAPSRLYENVDGDFGPVDPSPLADDFPVRSSGWADWTNDGDPDLLVLGHGYRASRAFVGEEGTGFSQIEIPGITGREWLSAAFGDLDNDGWPDAVLVSEERAVVFHNEEGVLRRTMRLPGVKAGRMAALVDVDNDGLLDIFVVQGAIGDPPKPRAINHPNLFFRQKQDGFRRVRGAGVAGPRHGNGGSVSAADYDRDGRMDLFVSHGYLDVGGRFQLLRNESVTGNTHVTVHLEGPKTNPHGFGSQVVVRAGRSTIRRQVTDGFSFRTQSSPGVVHIGVGRARRARVEVRWADGRRSCVRLETGRSINVSFTDAAAC